MRIDLSSTRAVVSGSTAGIGFAIATGLARAGAAVTLNGRRKDSIADALARLRALVPDAKVDGAAADLATDHGIAEFLRRVPEADILVNNLGIFEPKEFTNISDDDWRRFFETNVMTGVRLSRHYLPPMLERNWGRIVFISSESAVNIPREMIHYGMTKTAQLAVARGLAELTAGSDVTVNSVLPGPTRSEGVASFLQKMQAGGASEAEVEAEFIARNRPSSLLKRLTSPEEVANMAVYLCSREASATNGAALRADGGVVRSIL